MSKFFAILRSFVALSLAATVTAATASAATLSAVQGRVQVNNGAGFKTVDGPVELQPGDQVMVQDGGTAQVSFGPNNVVTVTPGSVYSVPTVPPGSGLGNAAGLGNPTLLTGVVVAGGVIGGVVAITSSSDDKPSSP
jgi:hypothetical protein